jgi:hypothetical protein
MNSLYDPNIRRPRWRARLWAAGVALVLSGCATPTAIKTASKTQRELIGELDKSVQALENGLVQFHRDNEAQIRQVGRVLIAQQAINVIIERGGLGSTNDFIGVDKYLAVSNTKIRPFVDNAFTDAALRTEIEQTTKAMNASTNLVARALLQIKLDNLNLHQSELANKPPKVAALEEVLLSEIARQKETAKNDQRLLEIVRAQGGLMKVLADTVDEWLALDVTVTKEQAENLENSVIAAQRALGGAK